MKRQNTKLPYRYIIVALMLLCIGGAHAQKRGGEQIIRAYPSIGATASQIGGDELKGYDKWGFTAGVGAAVKLSQSDKWHLSLEADFSQRGASNRTNNPYSLLYFSLNYVDIPLTIHFTDPWGGITIGTGLVYSRLVQQPHGLILYSNNFVPDTSDMTFLRNDVAAAIDVRFPIWRGLTFNIRYQHSLFPVKRDWHFHGYRNESDHNPSDWSNNCYNSSVSIRLLYLFGTDDSHYKKQKKHNKKQR